MTENLKETARLLEIMRALRDPETGCPWDIEQTHATLKKYVIEEAYEVAETLDGEDIDAMVGELGDLLLQVVFHAEIGRGDGEFDFERIAKAISDKMIARHPHVFGNASARNIEEQSAEWEKQKEKERGSARVLDGVSIALPALTRALKLQKRAARVGFDWDEVDRVWEKLDEEIGEFREASPEARMGEFGDMLFVMVNLARHYGIDPEEALASTNQKFISRFEYVEDRLHEQQKAPQEATLEAMEELWQRSKSNTN